MVATDLFISEYIEGSSNNKALEIFNGTGATIDLAAGGYKLELYSNGSATVTTTLNLTGTIASGSTFVIANSLANASILAVANITSGVTNYNGDDAIVLRKGSTIIDAIGQVGFDPGTQWGSGLTSTLDRTLRRKSSIIVGDSNATNVFDPSVEWDGFAQDTINGLGSHSINSGGTPATLSLTTSLASFSEGAGVNAATGTVTRTGNTTNALIVNLASSDTTEATVSPTVTIAAGQTSATFGINAVEDTLVDGSQAVTLTAAATGFSSATTNLTVTDNDVMNPITKIHTIQGSGVAATAGTFTIEGVVVGDFQGASQLGGFYIQEEDIDADGSVLTSEAIFVNSLVAVNAGDKVRITGIVAESSVTPSFNQAVITPSSASDIVVLLNNQQALVTATMLDLPTAAIGDLERYEGMLVTLPETLTVTETFGLGRFGEVVLSSDGRLFNPTNFIDPNDSDASGTSSSGSSNVGAVTAQQDLNNRRRIILDDGSTATNLSNVPYIDTTDASTLNDTLRIGSTVSGLTGVLGFGFNNYRIQATQTPIFDYAPRPELPDVGGSVKVGSFNVLNYFNGDGLGGGFPTARGANTADEFARQRDKIIAAIEGLNADVVGLIEMENDGDGPTSAIADLVNGLNAATAPGTYDFIRLANTTGSAGTDAIKVAFIYKPNVVAPVGNAIYFNDPAYEGLGRPPLAQTFEVISTGAVFTPIINHFKSKSAGGATGLNLDQGDGQGAFNDTRKQQATALLNFVGQIQTATGDSDVMVLGDINAYGEEDPIDILRAGGLTKLVTATDSYVFNGQTGSLDHALVTSSLLAQVTGAAKWNINSAEPITLDYNDAILSSGENPAEDRNDTSLYQANPFRSSDHDPVLVGLNLTPSNQAPTAVNLTNTVTAIAENTSTTIRLKVADIKVVDDGRGVNVLSLSGNDASIFELDGNALFVKANTTFNFEAKSTYDVTVAVDDAKVGNSPDAIVNFALAVTDINEAPTAVNFVNSFTNLAENTSTTARLKVADITVTDDALGTNVLSISGIDANFFELDGNAVYLKANTALDFETKTSYNISVNVNDASFGSTPTASANLMIGISNVNEAPTVTGEVVSTGQNTGNPVNSITIDLADNLTDPDANGLAGALLNVTSTNNGAIANIDQAARLITFTPTAGFSGTASFKYTITDAGGLTSNEASVFVEVGKIITGSNKEEVLLGNNGNDYISAGNGKDIIFGLGGNDTLFGNNGKDIIFGGAGDDLIDGGNGSDFLTGGIGRDKFVLTANAGNDIITDFENNFDLFALSGGLTFGQLSVTTKGNNTLINLGNNTLATLLNVSSNLITAEDFLTI